MFVYICLYKVLLLPCSFQSQMYLVDYGLANLYMSDGKHRPYEEDRRRAHNGTIEFTSIDAHRGVRMSLLDMIRVCSCVMYTYVCVVCSEL